MDVYPRDSLIIFHDNLCVCIFNVVYRMLIALLHEHRMRHILDRYCMNMWLRYMLIDITCTCMRYMLIDITCTCMMIHAFAYDHVTWIMYEIHVDQIVTCTCMSPHMLIDITCTCMRYHVCYRDITCTCGADCHCW